MDGVRRDTARCSLICFYSCQLVTFIWDFELLEKDLPHRQNQFSERP